MFNPGLIKNCRNDFVEIMEMLDKRLNDKGKNWRHVFKVRQSEVVLRPIHRLMSSFTGSYRSRLFAPCRVRERRHLLQVSTSKHLQAQEISSHYFRFH